MRPTPFIKLIVILSLIFLSNSTVQPEPSTSKSNILIILDCSLSMRNKAPSGTSRMKIAKKLIKKYIEKYPNENYAFMAFGSGQRLGCTDSKILIDFKDKEKNEKIFKRLESIHAYGATPLVKSLKRAVNSLNSLSGYREILLISDGSDNCDEDVAKVVHIFNESQIHLKIVMIYFNLKDRDAIDPLRQIETCTMVDIKDVPTYHQLFEILVPDHFKQIKKPITVNKDIITVEKKNDIGLDQESKPLESKQ